MSFFIKQDMSLNKNGSPVGEPMRGTGFEPANTYVTVPSTLLL